MHKYDYRPEMSLGRVELELSLKPFKSLVESDIEAVSRKLFSEWKPLIDRASSLSVMLWTADGSEILEYTGNLDKKFSRCDLIGIGNPTKEPKTESEFLDLHVRPVPYCENIPSFTYRDLKNIIFTLKRIGKECTGMNVEVVETFDPGPEFAKSDFKYKRHPEISVGSIMGKGQWVHCSSKLKSDSRRYAAFPDGIPEGTPFGTFLGKQFAALARDVGFDRIWLSNGFGFSLQSWNCCGELFDGKRFDFAEAKNVSDSISCFWRSFSAEIGDRTVETRGSNLSVAMDISAHGCPVDDIYKYNIVAPPNSPWAALNSRFGLELCGYLSRISSLPRGGYNFRYYIHDPWWFNSPWFDRYGSHPHDIYLPLSLARIGSDGKVTPPSGICLLSADDSFGNLPERCPYEVIPHLLRAYNDLPVSCGPVTWLYPFETYCQMGLRDGHMDRIFMDDWFIESAIDFGLPLSGVISDTNFFLADTAALKKTILLTCVPEEETLLEKCVFKALAGGMNVMLYGSTLHASEKMRRLIGVDVSKPIEGCFTIKQTLVKDIYEKNDLSERILHSALVSGGGICEISTGKTELCAEVEAKNGENRAYATYNKSKRLGWIRGSFPHRAEIKFSLPEKISPTEAFPPALLIRSMLSRFGFDIHFSSDSSADELPLTVFSEGKDSFFMTTFAKDMNVKAFVSTPLGAPICTGTDAKVENSVSEMISPKWQHEELCVFIKQKERSHIICRSETPGDSMRVDKRLSVSGLIDAEVTVRLPEPYAHVMCHIGENAWKSSIPCTEMKYSDDGLYAFIPHVNGKIYVSFQWKETRDEYRRLGYFRMNSKDIL